VELFAQTEHDQPRYFLRRRNGSSSAAELVMIACHDLLVAADVARARVRDLLRVAAPVAPRKPLPSLYEGATARGPGAGRDAAHCAPT
jgi:hypothetical protein